MALEDYGGLIQAGQNLVPDVSRQLATTAALSAQAQEMQANAQVATQKAIRAHQFQQAFSASDGSPKAIAHLMMQFPEAAEQLKMGLDAQDKAQRDADFKTSAEIYSAASSGNWDLAGKLAQSRYDAEKAAGNATPGYEAAKSAMDAAVAGDPDQRKAVLTFLGSHLAAVAGPEQFSSVYGALNKDKGYTLGQGETRFNDDNKPVASVAAKPDFLVVPEGGKAIPLNPAAVAAGQGGITGGGGPASSPAGSTPVGVSPAAASVASTLASSGLPAPVVAGFMGNFHAEGGYNGAQGDGGSASGIAQWHSDRASNFERIIGKPVTEATPEEQAKFVVWEMQNPEAAGMTVAQRDAILNAKTPAQAAALIDQHYERSSGRDRNVRMAAANAFAGLVPQGGPSAPAAPTAAPTAGDVPGTIYGNPKPKARILTPEETKARGLDTAKVYQMSPDGAVSAVGDSDSLSGIPGNANLSGPAYLATVPPNLATQVKALAEGRLPMPSSFALAKPYWQKLLQMTAQYDPTFDAANAPARKAAITAFTGMGKAAQVVGSVNRVANHLNTLWNESQKLAGPETGWSVTNSLLAGAGQSFEPADAKAYDTAVGFVAGELEKIARNSPGTEAGVERVVKNLGRKNSTQTREAAIKTAVDIIAGAIDPLKDQYNSAFTNDSTRPRIPWISPQAQKVYQRIGGTNGGVDLSLTGAGADTNAPSNVVRVGSVQQYNSLPSGAHYIDPNGVPRVKR
jgi:hypothetical protein